MSIKPLTKEEAKKFTEPPKVPVTAKSFSLDSLIKLGQIKKEITIGEDLKITLRTLSEVERDEAFSLLSNSDLNDSNILVRAEVMKRPILALSIDKINDLVFDTPESKKLLLEKLREFQTAVVDLIYIEYTKLLNDQIDILSKGLKKN